MSSLTIIQYAFNLSYCGLLVKNWFSLALMLSSLTGSFFPKYRDREGDIFKRFVWSAHLICLRGSQNSNKNPKSKSPLGANHMPYSWKPWPTMRGMNPKHTWQSSQQQGLVHFLRFNSSNSSQMFWSLPMCCFMFWGSSINPRCSMRSATRGNPCRHIPVQDPLSPACFKLQPACPLNHMPTWGQLANWIGYL